MNLEYPVGGESSGMIPVNHPYHAFNDDVKQLLGQLSGHLLALLNPVQVLRGARSVFTQEGADFTW